MLGRRGARQRALSQQAADAEAISDARATTALLGRSVAEPALPAAWSPATRARWTGSTGPCCDRLLVGDVKRIKIWRRDGTIVYSDTTRLIGSRYPLGSDEVDVLDHGSSDAEISDLSRPENRFEPGAGGLLEVYTRIHAPEGEPLLFEAYYSARDIAVRRQQVYDAFRRSRSAACSCWSLVTTPLLWALTRRLDRAAPRPGAAARGGRRRLRRPSADGSPATCTTGWSRTSPAPRSRCPRRPATRRPRRRRPARLDADGESLRSSLRSLRSLLVEIYPPDLAADGLAAALAGPGAPRPRRPGVTGRPSRSTAWTSASDESVALVWRVAQEAVRNALRHADADHADRRRSARRQPAALEVTDDGVGFDPARHGAGGTSACAACAT